jgi:hypothetical protein
VGLGLLAADTGLAGAGGLARFARERPMRTLWLALAVLVATVFTVTDWRMTKHMAPLLLLLHLAFVPPRHAARWRVWGAALALLGMLIWNAATVQDLAANFAAFIPTPDW